MRPLCTISEHVEMKASPSRWQRETTWVGFQDIGDSAPVHLRNCRACRTTLVIYAHVDHIAESWVEEHATRPGVVITDDEWAALGDTLTRAIPKAMAHAHVWLDRVPGGWRVTASFPERFQHC